MTLREGGEGSAPLEDGGPVETARRWLEDIFTRGDVSSAWRNTDPDYRLALAQAVIFLNEQHPALSGSESEELAVALAEERPIHPLWGSFAILVEEEFRNDLGEVRVEDWDAATTRRVDTGYELVLLPEKTGEGQEPPEMGARGFLTHFRDGRWQVAGLSERRAVPGWPPDLGY